MTTIGINITIVDIDNIAVNTTIRMASYDCSHSYDFDYCP